MSTRHSLGMVEGANALFVAGAVNSDGSVAGLSGPISQKGDIVVTKTGTGTYTVVITPFKSPQGVAIPMVAALTGTAEFSWSYSGVQLTISVSTFSDFESTAANEAFNFYVWGF